MVRLRSIYQAQRAVNAWKIDFIFNDPSLPIDDTGLPIDKPGLATTVQVYQSKIQLYENCKSRSPGILNKKSSSVAAYESVYT